MALKYEFTKGRPKSIKEDECYNTCMWLMVCGVSEVKKENAETIANRINLMMAIDGGSGANAKAIARFDGLKLNVTPLTALQFLKKLTKDVTIKK